MGKCYSRKESVATEDDSTKEAKDAVKHNSTEGKDKNEQTANGQVENAGEASVNDLSNGEENKTESLPKDKKAKSNKEPKTVRITETTTSEVKTETKVTVEKSDQKSDDLPKPTQVIKSIFISRSCCSYIVILYFPSF